MKGIVCKAHPRPWVGFGALQNAAGPLLPWSRAGPTRIELLQATRIEEGEAFPAPDVFLTLIPALHCGRRE